MGFADDRRRIKTSSADSGEANGMSKRRKNAGAGYGYMFHGAFKEKKDAVAKERKTKGAWVKGTPTNHGYRYIVMSPRTNPIKRKKKAPRENSVAWGKKNPTELLVMGANPESQEIVARPGQTITIRVNPTALSRSSDDSRFMLAAAAQLYPGKSLAALSGAELSKVAMLAARLKRENPAYFGFGPSHPTRKQLAESRRAFKRAVRAKTKDEREYIHSLRPRRVRGQAKLERFFHEVYGQWEPRGNPSAEALRESFTGTEVDRVTVHREGHMPAGDYALLGKLLALYVKPLLGGQVQVIKPRGTLVTSDESARQLYFVGGDQDISAALGVFGAIDRGAGLFELGEARRIDYKQRKTHVPDPDVDEWRHEFGEESGVRPKVLFDAKHERLLLEGGEYVVRAEGIVN
jgi:hypothetical protein